MESVRPLIVTIQDPSTKKETIIDLNNVAYVDEGKNTQGQPCVWVQMRNGDSYSFVIDYDTFTNFINSVMKQANWNGVVVETKENQ